MKEWKQPLLDVKKRFDNDLVDHKMTIYRDDGLYRHLNFARPAGLGSTWYYWFEIITWPGVLMIRGDCGSYVFSRITDMFEFFNDPMINPGYWGEKVIAVDKHSPVYEFSSQRLSERVTSEFNGFVEDRELDKEAADSLWRDISEEVLCAMSLESAHQLLSEFSSRSAPDFSFVDTWDWDLKDFSYQYLWCCWAILYAIAQYKAAKAETAPDVVMEDTK